MEERKQFLALLIFFQIYQGLVGGEYIEATPEKVVVNPGENVTFMCKLRDNLKGCIWAVNGKSYFLDPSSPEEDGVVYTGRGLESGECGMLIRRVHEELNGTIKCSLIVKNKSQTQDAFMSLVVAVKPKRPELVVTLGSDGKNSYKEMDTLTASCIVKDGRPVANISWYLGDELLTEGLQKPTEMCFAEKSGLCTIQQNLTRTLHASDDKKELKCVAGHHSFKTGNQSEQYTIYVNYPPKASNSPFEKFGLVEGVNGEIPIIIEANPKPVIYWSIDGETTYEGTSNGRYSVKATQSKEPGVYESVLVIDTLTKEDTNKLYKVTAHNDAGEREYSVTISTNPAPKVFEMGADLMIVIVVAIIIILLVLGVFYTRAKGMFCFAGPECARAVGESSDTESADHTTDQKSKLNLVSVFKKKSDKVAADKEMLKSEQPQDKNDKGENLVYAELDLAARPAVVVRVDDDKTEYAEIIHTQPSSK